MSSIELAHALHALVGELDAAAEAVVQAEFGLTHSQLAFLMPLFTHGDLDVSSLAASNRVSIAAVSKRVGWFVDRGLINADHPEGDGKRVVLSLTSQGRRLAKSASERLASRLEDLLAGWPQQRREQFRELVLEATESIRANSAHAVPSSSDHVRKRA
jgi:DNA-binding MarR family transcriptional regulator